MAVVRNHAAAIFQRCRRCLAWMAAGGVIYTAGAIFLVLDHRVRSFHAAGHVFVPGGSGCHSLAILAFVA